LRHRLEPGQQRFHLPLRHAIGQDGFRRLGSDDVGHPVVEGRRATPSDREPAARQTTAPFYFRQRLPTRFHRASLLTSEGFIVSCGQKYPFIAPRGCSNETLFSREG